MAQEERKPPPTCKAILLCDTVLVDIESGRTSVVGITDTFTLAEFPGETNSFFVYLFLTGGIGGYTITVEIHNLRNGDLVFYNEVTSLEFPDRDANQILAFRIPSLSVDEVGVYDLVVFADWYEVDRHKFRIRTIEDFENGEAEEGPEGDPNRPGRN
jgi:hypothetical protein